MATRPADLVHKLEWAVVGVAAVVGYWLTGGSWWLFALLLLAPDLGMLGYLAGSRVGALTYNAVHVLAWPAVLIPFGLIAPNPLAVQIGLIWLAHIALDRALGYGLKLASGFKDTTLGRIGG